MCLAGDAELVARSAHGERCIPAAEFFLGYLTSALDETEVLTAVPFRKWRAATGAPVAEVSRRHGDYALVGLAAFGLDGDGRIDRAALTFFGAGSTPVRVSEAERAGRPDGFRRGGRGSSAQRSTRQPSLSGPRGRCPTLRCLAEAGAGAGAGAR